MSDIRSWHAPGRVSLLGEHLDYNGGQGLSFAINRGITLKARLRDDNLVRAWTQFGSARDNGEFTIGDRPSGWLSYISGVIAGLDVQRGLDLVYESTLPGGAGLSSSAALCVVTAQAINGLHQQEHSTEDLAQLCADAESHFAGTPTGLLDQLTLLHAQADSMLHLDFKPASPTASQLPATWASTGLAMSVIDTGTRRTLTDGRYAERVDECRRAREAMGLESLSDASLIDLVQIDDEKLKKRAQHVFTEGTRVQSGLRAVEQGDWERFGALLNASQTSLAEDFEVSSAPLDTACELALEHGALGAKLIGAGFAGSVITLTERAMIDSLRDALIAKFAHIGWKEPHIFEVTPSAGVHEVR